MKYKGHYYGINSNSGIKQESVSCAALSSSSSSGFLSERPP